MKRIFLFLLLIILAGFFTPAQAFEIRQGNDVTVPKDTTVQGSLVAGGKTVTIDGTVNGDVYCGTQTLSVRGTVYGDVICAAQTMNISGVVTGSVRGMGQLVDMTGIVNRNATVMGQTVTLESSGTIFGEMMAAGQSVTVQGPVTHGILAAGQTVFINNTIGGNVQTAAASVALGEKARVNGDFTYTSPAAVSQATGAAITGKVSHLLPPKESKQMISGRNWIPKAKPWPVNALSGMIFYLIVGAIVVSVAGEKVKKITAQMLARPWFDGFVGFLTMIAAPIAIMMVAMTIIGIPVSILLFIVFMLMIVLARVYVSVIIGEKILTAFGKTKKGLLLLVIVGVIIVELFVKIPILGWIVSSLVTFWGLGGLVLSFGKQKVTK